MFFVSSDVN